jgi:hypothetical protein
VNKKEDILKLLIFICQFVFDFPTDTIISIVEHINRQESLDLNRKVNDFFAPVILRKKISRFNSEISSNLPFLIPRDDQIIQIIQKGIFQYIG